MILQDENLSWRARGIAAYILAHPDTVITIDNLKDKGREGREAVRTALKELEDAGYLVRERRNDSNGHIVVKVILHSVIK